MIDQEIANLPEPLQRKVYDFAMRLKNSGGDRIVVRGIGPSPGAAGVGNALADPTPEMRDGNGVLLRANHN